MKTEKLNFTFLIKIVMIMAFAGGLVSLYVMKPIYIKGVAESTSLAEKSRGVLYKTEDVYVYRKSVFSDESSKNYIFLVKGNKFERTVVLIDEKGQQDGFVKVESGLIMEDQYVLNPPRSMESKVDGIADWRFDY